MPVAAMPNVYGVGDFGDASYHFIDLIANAGFDLWQILPLNPLGFGNSPYQPYSSFAGDEIYLNLEQLVVQGLLSKEQLMSTEVKEYIATVKESKHIDYESVRKFKGKLLQLAYKNFVKNEDYELFASQEWVSIYAVFIALKKQNGLKCWNEWPKEQREWIHDKAYDLTPLTWQIEYEKFVQYEFMKQWKALRAYANQKKIQIMGDLPFYVGIDSLDVWQNQEEFLLGADGKPSFVAGVPPDYFSATGQRWGNPIYDWEKMQKNQYRFWKHRLSYCSELFDITRIDHFRAFDTYWKIPSTCETAVEGEWVEAPGKEFFEQLLKEYPHLNIVIEDLGELREEVHELRDMFGFKGMKVLQFTFNPMEEKNQLEDRENLIVYTGTHDNQTLRGWYEAQTEEWQEAAKELLIERGYEDKKMSKCFIEMALDSIADIVIIPYQDFVDMGEEGRINTPGTLGSPNWEFKVKDFSTFEDELPNIKALFQRKKLEKKKKVEE